MKKFYQFKPKQSEDGINELLVYGDITSLKWLEDDVTSFDFAQELSEMEGPLNVRINSYGGEVSQGLAIYNLLKDYDGEVTTINDGFACSSASVVFMAGTNRIMPKSSLLLIHNAWSVVQGDSNEMKKQAEDLEKITQPSLEIYKEVSNLSEEELKEMMDRETWITADEALNYGFATDIKNDVSNQSLENHYLSKMVMENKILQTKVKTLEELKQPTLECVNEVIDYDKIQEMFNESISQLNIKEEKHEQVLENKWDAFFNLKK